MKRLFLFAILSAFTLCLSAQSMPSVSEIESNCKKLQNNINIITNELDDIIKAEKKFCQDKGGTLGNEDIKKNDSLLATASLLLDSIPNVYRRDTASNIALIAFDVIQKSLNSYCDAIYDKKRQKLDVDDDFLEVIDKQLGKLNEQIDGLGLKAIDVPETDTPNEGEDISETDPKYLIYIIGLGIILVVLIVVIVSHFRLQQRLKRHRADIEQLKTDLYKINEEIKGLGYTRNSTSGNGKAFTNTYEISKIKDEVKDLRSIVDNIQKGIKSSHSPSVEQQKVNVASQSQQAGTNKQSDNVVNVSISSNTPNAKSEQTSIDVSAQMNGTFKVSPNNAYFEIRSDAPDSRIGTFVVKDLDPSKMKAAISNRHLVLESVCDILGQSGSSKIVVIEPGTAEKIGNEWRLINKAKISIE